MFIFIFLKEVILFFFRKALGERFILLILLILNKKSFINMFQVFSRGHDPGTDGDPAGEGAQSETVEARGEMLPEAVRQHARL